MCCRQAYPSTGRLLCVSRSVGIWRFRWIAGGCPRWTAGQLAIPWRVWKWGFPQVTAMSIGAIDDQSESIIIVFLGSLFSDKPMKWYREHCHVFLVDFVIGGWNTSRQPYMVCPNTPNSHSGSSLSLVNWQHVGLSPFLDINPSSCGFSVEFAPVGRQNICWTSIILRWWMEAWDISYAGNSVEPGQERSHDGKWVKWIVDILMFQTVRKVDYQPPVMSKKLLVRGWFPPFLGTAKDHMNHICVYIFYLLITYGTLYPIIYPF